jgi:hypothetical protein
MKNAIEIERVQNGWIIRAGAGLLSNGLESVAMKPMEVSGALVNWLADEGSRVPELKPYLIAKDEDYD